MPGIIAYFRVSTKRQGDSGLGLEGQRSAVRQYAESRGERVIATYTEVESGKKADRAELVKAIGHAKLAKATLVVAKLDRLARNVAFLSSLMESGVEFVACDNPNANRLTIHIIAAVAEDEAQRISDRTKAALAAAKVRGVKLGSARHGHWKDRENQRGWRQATLAAGFARRKAAANAYGFLLPAIRKMRERGASFAAIASQLNSDGHRTSTGKPWTATATWRILSRA